NEAYRTDAQVFAAKAEAMTAAYTVREEGTTGIPVVHPPAGSDVYLIARLWEWWPVLELEKDQSYRLHLTSMDWQHGFSLQPTNINIQVQPGYEMVLTLTPDEAGEFSVVCNEYCGIGHHTMVGKIYVTD
ncbi:MAG: cytochrome C oxidase subunit II, partial [Armatimonadota bacterium]